MRDSTALERITQTSLTWAFAAVEKCGTQERNRSQSRCRSHRAGMSLSGERCKAHWKAYERCARRRAMRIASRGEVGSGNVRHRVPTDGDRVDKDEWVEIGQGRVGVMQNVPGASMLRIDQL